MLKKYQEKKAQKYNAPVVAVAEWKKAFIERAERQLAAAKVAADDADKILKLKELSFSIDKARYDARQALESIALKRADKKEARVAGASAVIGAVAVGVPFAVLVAPAAALFAIGGAGVGLITAVGTKESAFPARLKEVEALAGNDGDERLAYLQSEAAALLKKTVEKCDLGKISKSPRLKEALERHPPLREKFEAANAATAPIFTFPVLPPPRA
jgi:hypothetical protein